MASGIIPVPPTTMMKYYKNFIICGEIDYHCLLCAESFQELEDLSRHIRWEKHRRFVKNQIYFPKLIKDSVYKLKKQYYYCELCNFVTMATTADDEIQKHIKDKNHIINKSHPQVKPKAILPENHYGIIFLGDKISLNSQQWHGINDNECLLCGTSVQDVDDHVSATDHMINLIKSEIKLANDHYYRKISEEKAYCFTCKKILPLSDITVHSIQTEYYILDRTNDKATCRICRVTLHYDFPSLLNHRKVHDVELSKIDDLIREDKPSITGQEEVVESSLNVNIPIEDKPKGMDKSNVDVKSPIQDPKEVDESSVDVKPSIQNAKEVSESSINVKSSIIHEPKEIDESSVDFKSFDIDDQKEVESIAGVKLSIVYDPKEAGECSVSVTKAHIRDDLIEEVEFKVDAIISPIMDDLKDPSIDKNSFIIDEPNKVAEHSTEAKSSIIDDLTQEPSVDIKLTCINGDNDVKPSNTDDLKELSEYVIVYQTSTEDLKEVGASIIDTYVLKTISESSSEDAKSKMNDSRGETDASKKDEPKKQVEKPFIYVDHGKHRTELKEYGKDYFIKLNEAGRKGFCSLCHTYILAGIDYFMKHITGMRHQAFLEYKYLVEKMSNPKPKVTVFVSTSMNEYVEEIRMRKRKPFFWINRNLCVDKHSFMLLAPIPHVGKTRCYICDKVFTDKEPYYDHFKSSIDHREKLANTEVVVSLENEFVRVVQHGLYHCGFCNRLFPGWSLLERHIASSKHFEAKKSIPFNARKFKANVSFNDYMDIVMKD